MAIAYCCVRIEGNRLVGCFGREIVNQKKYGNDSISSLKGADRVRLRPQVMLGSSHMAGAKHTVIEILGNALDEAGSGYGDQLEVFLNEDYSVGIRDYGRGVPLGWNEKEQDWNYKLIYAELYAGGKYDEDGGSQAYLKSLTDEDWKTFRFEDYPNLASIGLNGLGGAATQYTSEWFEVHSFRDGKKTSMKYAKGSPILDSLLEEDTDEPNGTLVMWKPDDEVFNNDTKFPERWVRRLAENTSIVTGMAVTYTGPSGEPEYFKGSSIQEHLGGKVGEVATVKKIVRSIESRTGDVLVCEANIVIGQAPTSESNVAASKFYQNYVEVTAGSHQQGIDSAFREFFEARTRDYGIRLKPEDFKGLLTAYVSARANKIDPEGQTKNQVNAEYIYEAVRLGALDLLSREWARGTGWLVESVKHVVEVAELRLQSEELRKKIREVNKVTSNKKTMPEKFKSCRAYEKKNWADVELWISEGDSASGGLANARNGETQALFPVRGKSLNLFKAKIDKILDNKEVADIIQILGAGVDLGAGLGENFSLFDINKLRCSKLIIASDADVDGLHIRMLLTVLVWRLFPEIIRHGMLYIAETPLYSIGSGKKATYFYSAEELDTYFDEFGGRGSVHVKRYKGLGTMGAEELNNSTMRPDSRRLVQLQFDPDDPEIYDVFEVLFGKSTDTRRNAILASLLTGEDNLDDVQETLAALESLVEETDIEDVREFETVSY